MDRQLIYRKQKVICHVLVEIIFRKYGELDRVGGVNVYAPFPKCGHSPVVCEYLFDIDCDLEVDVHNEIQLQYLWHRGDYCQMSEALWGVDWELEFSHLSVNLAYEMFVNILNSLINIYVPMCAKDQQLPWSVL